LLLGVRATGGTFLPELRAARANAPSIDLAPKKLCDCAAAVGEQRGSGLSRNIVYNQAGWKRVEQKSGGVE
jgi:hypothetical protein